MEINICKIYGKVFTFFQREGEIIEKEFEIEVSVLN